MPILRKVKAMSESAPPPKILPEHFGAVKSLEITVRRGILSAEDFALKTANRRSFRDAVEMIKERDAAIEQEYPGNYTQRLKREGDYACA